MKKKRRNSSVFPVEAFAFETLPTWQEDSSQLSPAAIKDHAGIAEISFCHRVAGRIPLSYVYGYKIKVSLVELSSCFVVRSEHQFTMNERQRLSLRKHIFEVGSNEVPSFSIAKSLAPSIVDEILSFLSNEGQIANREDIVELVDNVLSAEKWQRPIEFLDWTMEILYDAFQSSIAETIFRTIFWAYGDPTLRVRSISNIEAWREYLGFIDLRTYSTSSPVAFALLKAPRTYRDDENVSIIAGNYSPIFGGPSFISSAYVMHSKECSGSLCAQATAINALSLLADRGSKLMGGYTLTYLGKEREKPGVFSGAQDCLVRVLSSETSNSKETTNAIRITGMTFDELGNVLGSSENFETSTDCVRIPRKLGVAIAGRWKKRNEGQFENEVVFDAQELARSISHAYLIARCPIILFVNDVDWYRHLLPQGQLFSQESPHHAVLINGFRRGRRADVPESDPNRVSLAEGANWQTDISEFIVHDPGFAPFLKLTCEQCFDAAEGFDKTSGEFSGLLHFICVTPSWMKCHISDCIHSLNEANDLRSWLSWKKYFDKTIAAQTRSRFTFRLVHRDDIISSYYRTSSFPITGGSIINEGAPDDSWETNRDQLEDSLSKLDDSLYWCVAGYVGFNGLQDLWLFDAELEPDANDSTPWNLWASWNHMGWLGCETRNPQLSKPDESISEEPDIPLPREPEPPLDRSLAMSVMTSCSERRLINLCEELVNVGGTGLIDLYILRDIDIEDMLREDKSTLVIPYVENLDERSSAVVMSQRDNVSIIVDWVVDQLKGSKCRIAALATYFPHIVTLSTRLYEVANETLTLRELANRALVNSVLLAIELYDRGVMVNAIVEIVAGNILDECSCNSCEQNKAEGVEYVFEAERSEKIRMLCSELMKVVKAVENEKPDRKWAFSVELEPGPTYTNNGGGAIDLLLEQSVEFNEDGVKLSDHMGLNLDLAHEKIVLYRETAGDGSTALDFNKYLDHIVHAHICDNSGLHTRDQPVGWWSPVEKRVASEYRSLELLTKLANLDLQSRQLPFSATVALELEGCARLSWILESLSKMRFMFEFARNHPSGV